MCALQHSTSICLARELDCSAALVLELPRSFELTASSGLLELLWRWRACYFVIRDRWPSMNLQRRIGTREKGTNRTESVKDSHSMMMAPASLERRYNPLHAREHIDASSCQSGDAWDGKVLSSPESQCSLFKWFLELSRTAECQFWGTEGGPSRGRVWDNSGWESGNHGSDPTRAGW